tara:strand:- start:1212 stop:1439 length:228 start_codon:yes stop_codon:yes gene_type:complete
MSALTGYGLEGRVLHQVSELLLESRGHPSNFPNHPTELPGDHRQPARTEYHKAQQQDDQDLATPDVSHGVNLPTP